MSDPRHDQAIEHLRAGHPVADVAGAAGVSPATIRRWAKAAGVPLPARQVVAGPGRPATGRGKQYGVSLHTGDVEALRAAVAHLEPGERSPAGLLKWLALGIGAGELQVDKGRTAE